MTSGFNKVKEQIITQQLPHTKFLIATKREMKAKQIKHPCPSSIGLKHVAVFGSSDGESSDHSLVDLVSTKYIQILLFT